MGTPPEPQRPRKKRRWLRRILLAGLTLLIVLAAFHRPLLRWGLEWGGHRFAPMAGLKLDWGVGGTVTSDLRLSDVQATGDGAVRKIELRNASASYSLANLTSKGPGSFLQSLEIDDAHIALDLRTPEPAAPAEQAQSSPSAPPALELPRVLLHNINADIVTSSDEIVLRGLTLELSKGSKGDIRIDELVIPSQQLHLRGVRGHTEVQGNTLVITDLAVMEGLHVTRLAIDLEKLHEGRVGIAADLAIGGGTLALKANTADLGATVDAEVMLNGLASKDLQALGFAAADTTWRADLVTVQLTGPPSQPQKLHAELAAQASAIHAGNVQADRVDLSAGIDGGVFSLKSLVLQAASNRVEVTGQASLPDEWSKIQSVAPTLQWKLHAPELQRFFATDAPVTGSLDGAGTVTLADQKLQSATATVQGSALSVAGFPIASVNAEITTDADAVRIKALHARIDDKNSADLSGEVAIREPQPVKVEWRVALEDLAALPAVGALKSLASELKGKLAAEGSAEVNLTDVTKADVSHLKAAATVSVSDFAWRHYAVKALSLKAAAREGKIALEQLTVSPDASSTAEVTGSLSLADAMPFDLKWSLRCDDLAAAAKAAGAPEEFIPTAGVIGAHGDASGVLKDVIDSKYDAAKATAELSVKGVALKDARLESLDVVASLAGGRFVLKQLALKVDADNTLNASGTMALNAANDFEASTTGALHKLDALSGWMAVAKAPPFVAGSIDLAWQGAGQLATKQINGAGSLSVIGLRTAAMPDPLTATVKAEHKGAQTELTELEATAGVFHASAKASLSPENVRIPSLSLKAGETELVQGAVDLPLALDAQPLPVDANRPLSIRLKMEQLDFAQIAKVVGRESPVAGTASMDVDLHGLLPQLEGALHLELEHILAMKDKLEPASAKLEARLGAGRLKAHLTAEQKPLKPLDATAEVPVDVVRLLAHPESMADEEVVAHVVLPESELEIVKRLAPAIAEIKGRLGLDVSASGPLKSPKLLGRLTADVPLLVMKAAQAPEVKDAKVRVSFEGEHITIEDVSAILAGGTAKIGGKVDITSFQNPAFDIHVTAGDALLVRDESISQRANADLRLSGTLAKGDVSGRVELTRGRVFKEIEFLPLSLPDSLPPPPASAHRADLSAIRVPPPFDQWTFNIDVGTHDPIRLLGNILNGGVLVDLHARGTGAAPEVEGKVMLDNARLQLPFSRIALTRGNVIFAKEKFLEPELDIEGEALVDRYRVTLNATGSALDPEVRFSSSPPLSDGDIATLLATGATSDDLKSAGGVAANKAAFLFVMQMYHKLFKKSGRQHYDGDPPKLSFSFSMLNSGSTSRSVSAVYEVSPKVQAVGTVTESGGFRGLLYYLFRFK